MTAAPQTATAYARSATPESSYWYIGNLNTFLADAADTGGQFSLLEITTYQGGEPPRHVHHREDEAFYVLEGAITYYVGEAILEASAGTFVFLPREVPHSFTLRTSTARVLCLSVPGGFESHFRDTRFATPALALTLGVVDGPPDVGALVANLAEYGIEVVGPPGAPMPRQESNG
jgi:quercetin dioxygenase-like cupin family protein